MANAYYLKKFELRLGIENYGTWSVFWREMLNHIFTNDAGYLTLTEMFPHGASIAFGNWFVMNFKSYLCMKSAFFNDTHRNYSCRFSERHPDV